MSVPSVAEVVQKAETLGFAQRVKFGAKLGAQHGTDAGFQPLLSQARTYEAPALPALDAASLEVAKFLPMQKQNGAKHFDVEQVVLAASVAAKDVETLKAEIIGPNASHLSFASLRLCELARKFPDVVTSAHLLELLVSLPLKRRKPLIKSLIKERHSAVLDAYVTQHLANEKDGTEQIARIVHGLSDAVVLEWLPTVIDGGYQYYVRLSHLARYHSTVLLQYLTTKVEKAKVELDKLPADTDKATREIAFNKVTRTWEAFTTMLNNYGGTSGKYIKQFLQTPVAKGDKTLIAKKILLLAKACPSYMSHQTIYYPTLPTMVVQNFKFISELYEAELLDLCSICIRPEYGSHVYTFNIPAKSLTRALSLRFLELSLPRSVDHSVPEGEQITPTWIYSAAVSKLGDLDYWPEALTYAKHIKKWVEAYGSVRPAARLRLGSIWFKPIIEALVRVKSNIVTQTTTRLRQHYELALKQVKQDGPHTPEKQHEAVIALLPSFGKLSNLCAIWDIEVEIINLFMDHLAAETKVMRGKDVSKPDYHLRADFDTFHSFVSSVVGVASESHTALQIILDYVNANTLWKNSTSERKFGQFLSNIFAHCAAVALRRGPDDFSNAITKSAAQKEYEAKYASFCYAHTLATVKRFASTEASAGTLTDYESTSEHPLSVANMRRDFAARYFPLVVPFATVEPIFTLLFKTGTFVEMVKENKLPTVVAIIQHLPGAIRAPILDALMEAKVCTASQKLELTPYLTIANDSKVRKALETATSSSSPGERVAALVRLVRATNSLPHGSLDSEIFAEPLSELMQKQRTLMLKEAETTISHIIKRIKNTIFQDRVLFQHYAFMTERGDKKLFSSVWLAPGVGPTHIALWLEMLDDHLQNPNQTQERVEIEQPENYETALTPLGWEVQWGGYDPYAFWKFLAKRALSLGFLRQDAALIEFAVEIVCRIGIVASGASDPISDDCEILNAKFLMGHFLNMADAQKVNFALSTLIDAITKKYADADLLALKKAKLFRKLATEAPVTFVERLPQVFEVIQKSIATLKEEVAAADLSLNAIAKPALRTGFEEEEELEEFERKEIVTTLLTIPANAKRASQLTWLSDFVFNVGLKSWAAAKYVPIAWRIRLQNAFDAHKAAWLAAHGANKHHTRYPKPTGNARRKIESAASHAFAREIIAICPSALHIKIFQRIIAHIDPTEFFSHIPTPQSAPAADTEDVGEMARVGLLGRFTPTAMAAASIAARRPAAGRAARPSRGARRPVPSAGAVTSFTQLSLYHASVAQLTAIKNISKVWKRGQSTKSTDNSNFFLPTLCYGMEHWHPAQILAYGNALHAALLNPMRSQEIQKKLLILWTLLPTTNYADIVLFLQENDFNFFPTPEGAEEEEGEDGEKIEKAPAAEESSAPKPTLPLAVVEAAIHGTTMNDEPLAPLPFLLSPTFLSSSYSRVAIQAVQSLIKYAPEGLLTNALAYLLRDHRKKLKTSAHKQIIRFLASDVSLEHWEIFLSEWRNPRTHRDVRIVLLQAAFSAISVAKGETLEKVWLLLALAADFRDPEVVCALLKTRPLLLPARRSPIYHNLSETIFNSRIQSQFQSYTEITIPNDCAARYMATVIIPILARDDNIKKAAESAAKGNAKGENSMDVDAPAAPAPAADDATAMDVSSKTPLVNGSDLQFLAYASLIQWAGFLNEAQPGKPDYTAVAVRLIDYVVDAVHHDANFVCDNYKKMITSAQRCVYLLSQALWLLCFDSNARPYADVRADHDFKEEDYNIAGGIEIVESLMQRLVAFAEELASQELGPVPTNIQAWTEWIKQNEILSERRNKEKEREKEARKALSVARKVAKATSSPISPEAVKAVEDIEAMPKTEVEEDFIDPAYEEVTQRYRRFGNTVGAIVALTMNLDKKVLPKGYMLAEEQERIYAPLLKSRLASLPAFVNIWIELDIKQIHHTDSCGILAEGADEVEYLTPSEAFLKAYERTIRRVAANTKLQSLAKAHLCVWVTELLGASTDRALDLAATFIDSLLTREKTNTWGQSMPSIGSGSYYLEQIDGFSTKAHAATDGKQSRDNLRSRVERSVDVDIAFAIINQIITNSSHTATKLGGVLPKVMSMVEHLYNVICFELPGLFHIAEGSGCTVEGLVADIMNRLSWDSYHLSQTHRKTLIVWIVKTALQILENHPSTGAANKKFRKMWHGLLHKTSGALFAKYAPEYASRLIYYLVQEDAAVTTWVNSMVGEWLSPSNKITDPALAGVGTREHDLNAAVALIKDMVNVRLHTESPKGEGVVLIEDNFEFVDRLFVAALAAVNGNSTLPRILYERDADTYWKIFNTQIARAVFGGYDSNDANAPTSATLKTHLESIFTKDTRAVDWADKYDQAALIKTIEQIFCASFATNGVASQVAKYYPFAEIQLQYAAMCRRMALDLTLAFGTGSAVAPPKGAASSKSVWRPVFTALLARIGATQDHSVALDFLSDLALAPHKF